MNCAMYTTLVPDRTGFFSFNKTLTAALSRRRSRRFSHRVSKSRRGSAQRVMSAHDIHRSEQYCAGNAQRSHTRLVGGRAVLCRSLYVLYKSAPTVDRQVLRARARRSHDDVAYARARAIDGRVHCAGYFHIVPCTLLDYFVLAHVTRVHVLDCARLP